MNALTPVFERRGHCLDALERITGEQPTTLPARAALAMARCLKYVGDLRELDALHRDLCALDSARAGEATRLLQNGGLGDRLTVTTPTDHLRV